MIAVTLFTGLHENKERIIATFAYNKQLQSIVKGIPGARWSYTHKHWHFPFRKEVVEQIIAQTKSIAEVDLSRLKTELIERKQSRDEANLTGIDPETSSAIQSFKKWMEQQRYSNLTVKTYLANLIQFFNYYASKGYMNIAAEDVHRFNYEVILANGLSVSFQKSMIGAIKLFYNRFSETSMRIERLQYPQKESRLPEVLSKSEVQQILNATDNLKHKSMLALIYACGLRRSELLHLKIKDIDGERKLIRIEMAKGKKDRYVPLTDKLRALLREYYQQYMPKVYLFEGQYGGQYGERSIELVLQQCVQKTRILKKVTLHTLRHSYATHQLESGTDIRYIQELLGHSSPKTTMIYTHVSSRKIAEIQSPFDDLEIKPASNDKNKTKQ